MEYSGTAIELDYTIPLSLAPSGTISRTALLPVLDALDEPVIQRVDACRPVGLLAGCRMLRTQSIRISALLSGRDLSINYCLHVYKLGWGHVSLFPFVRVHPES